MEHPGLASFQSGSGLLSGWVCEADVVEITGPDRTSRLVVADGVEFDRATFTVTTLGEEFVTDATGETVVADFPTEGEDVRLLWQEANQNFMLAPLEYTRAGPRATEATKCLRRAAPVALPRHRADAGPALCLAKRALCGPRVQDP